MTHSCPVARARRSTAQAVLLDPRYRRALVHLICLLLVASCSIRAVMAQDTPAESVCYFTVDPVEIDGTGDELAWQSAPWIGPFSLPWLRSEKRPPHTSTRAKLLWDRDYLYFFAEMEDADLFADVKEHDGRTWSNDVFELFFKPSTGAPAYYEFQVNAAGTVLDMLLARREAQGYEQFKADGVFHLESQVVRRGTLNKRDDRDEGWSVEGRIPWIDFLRSGGRPNPDDVWTFALCRYDYSALREAPDLSTSAPLASKPYPDFHRYEDYAPLRFAGPGETPEQGASAHRKWRFRPTPSRVVGSPEAPPPYRVRRAYPQLQVDFGIGVVVQPGTNRLIVITLDGASVNSSVRLRRFIDRPDTAEAETLIETQDTVFGIVFHPQFADNGYVFFGSNGPGTPPEAGRHTRVSRYTFVGDAPGHIAPESRQLIIEWPSDGHNGADATFGHDGMLYVTSGDGTGDSDTDMRGQSLDHLLAKVLRIDVDHPTKNRMYSIPPDNPFISTPGARPETWAYGLRNPWKITTDRETGHIWVGNNGQDLWEQAYLVRRGDNFGWSVYEGSHIFYANRALGPTQPVKPTVEHPHSEARSLTGGVVYYGDVYPELSGAYVYGDYSTGKIWAVKHDGTRIVEHREIADTSLQISGFCVNTRGELLVIDHRGGGEGGLYRLAFNTDDASADFPRQLSETGLFESVAGHRVAKSLIPYEVNAPLWSDGAYELRYIALPEADSRIDVTPSRGWGFPDGTVLVKSFAIEEKPPDPASRRWIETQLLTRQQGEWVGYSYAWNDSGTDAVLVEPHGADRSYQIETPSGTSTQSWRFVSRTECMVCHTRAANFVLGLTTLQLNRPGDRRDALDNPLRALEYLGVLRVDWKAKAVAAHRDLARAAGMNEEETARYIQKQTTLADGSKPRDSSLLTQPIDEYPRLVDPYDEQQETAARVRSYLHANCSACHVAAGGGNAAMELEFTRSLDTMNVVDVKPLHYAFEIPDARLIAPGDPQRSILLYRMMIRGRGQMPQLGTAQVDQRAVELLREWIANLAPADKAAD